MFGLNGRNRTAFQPSDYLKCTDQKLTISIKGNDIRLDPADLKNKKIKVSGTIELYKDRPEIVVANPANISVVKS